MNEQSARLALADAMQLHNERVYKAEKKWERLYSELEKAQAEMMATRRYRDAFRKAILDAEGEEVGRG